MQPKPIDLAAIGTILGPAGATPVPGKAGAGYKWIAEDTLFIKILRQLWRRDRNLTTTFRLARGKRVFAIWSLADPLPFLAYMFTFLPKLALMGIRYLISATAGWTAVRRKDKRGMYENRQPAKTRS